MKGDSSTDLGPHRAFEGYEYVKDEYCQTATYDNDASSIDDAVAKCSSDSRCVAIEDRWGTGLPPIGLCAKFKGKRAGAGTLLLKKGICSYTVYKIICTIYNFILRVEYQFKNTPINTLLFKLQYATELRIRTWEGLVHAMLNKQRTLEQQKWRKTFLAALSADIETIASIGFGQRIQTLVGSEAMREIRLKKLRLTLDEGDSENQVMKLYDTTVFF